MYQLMNKLNGVPESSIDFSLENRQVNEGDGRFEMCCHHCDDWWMLWFLLCW